MQNSDRLVRNVEGKLLTAVFVIHHFHAWLGLPLLLVPQLSAQYLTV